MSGSPGGCVLVLRPEPGASATAARAREAGFQVVCAPLFTLRAIGWRLPDELDRIDAVAVTSANAVRLAGPALDRLRPLPLYAVGGATAAAARAAGFGAVHAGGGDAAQLGRRLAAVGAGRVLHLAGADHRPLGGAGCEIVTRVVYAADAVTALPADAAAAIAAGAAVLVHSPAAGALLDRLALAAEVDRGAAALAAISARALAAAGSGWRAAAAADTPDDAALLAQARRLCDGQAAGLGALR